MHGFGRDRNRSKAELEKLERQSDIYERKENELLNGPLKMELSDLSEIGEALSMNPENSTLWNMRKSIILKWLESATDSFKESTNLFNNELRFTAVCLSQNPKSYAAWFHRRWCLLKMPDPPLRNELDVCKEYLSRDERNFHCWAYWYFLTNEIVGLVNPEQCLAFVTEKLIENFSNFSAWHYRSVLLSNYPQLKLSSAGERELLHNAFFTDPNDQSAWLYHRWILKLTNVPISPVRIATNACDDPRLKIVDVCFSEAINAPKEIESNVLRWIPLIEGKRRRLVAWKCLLKKEETTLDLKGRNLSPTCTDLSVDTCLRPFYRKLDAEDREELKLLEKLLEMEPDCKWVNLACLLLMTMEENISEDVLEEKIAKLIQIDPLRTNYYKDMRSKFIWARLVRNELPTSLSLKGKKITKLYFTQYLYFVKEIDLSDCQLRDLAGIELCQRLQFLDLSNNQLSKAPMEIVSCPRLQKCVLKGNPFLPNEQTKLREACNRLSVELIF